MGLNKLFIYIPTFNRPDSLRKQLNILLPQVAKYPKHTRILINDNASSAVHFAKFRKQYESFSNIQFRTNSGNIGANANIALGFTFAQSSDEFLWILSDDDIIVDNAVEYLLSQIDPKVDFYCFKNVNKPTILDHPWSKGCLTPMKWGMGLISNVLYNVKSVQESMKMAFFYHNSSFPHLAVLCATIKNKGVVRFKLLPREKLINITSESKESLCNYSLSHVCMPLLVALLPKNEAKSFIIEWLRDKGIEFYRNRKYHDNLYIQSKAIMLYYGGFAARALLILIWISYLLRVTERKLKSVLIKLLTDEKRKKLKQKLKKISRRFCLKT